MNPQRSAYGYTDAIDDKMRMTAFERVQRLYDLHESLTTNDLKAGFNYEGIRIPLVNPQRGIFKPKKMRYLLSITTVFPAPGKKVWYDDQREIHRRIIESEDTLDYAFMGQDPNAADNQWLLEAFKNQVPVIYFLGIAPGRYQAIIPTFISGWDPNALIAQVVFGVPNQDKISNSSKHPRTSLCTSSSEATVTSIDISRGCYRRLQRPLRSIWFAGTATARRCSHHF